MAFEDDILIVLAILESKFKRCFLQWRELSILSNIVVIIYYLNIRNESHLMISFCV